VLFDLVAAVWIGLLIGAALKMASPHANWVSWIMAALVGGLGAMIGLFGARMLGFSNEDDLHTRVVSAIFAVLAMAAYAAISKVAVRRMIRRTGRSTRPTIAF
jgi:hypothetical protein